MKIDHEKIGTFGKAPTYVCAYLFTCAVYRRIRTWQSYSFFFSAKKAITAMTMPSSHSQYFSRNPGSAFWTGGGVITAAGAGAGASCFTTGAGAGAATGSGAATGAGAALAFATFFLAFLTTGLGATCSVAATGAGAGCSATAAGSGAFSGAAATGAAGSAATSFGLVAQADKASAETSRATGKVTFCIFDMLFSREAVDEMLSGGILP